MHAIQWTLSSKGSYNTYFGSQTENPGATAARAGQYWNYKEYKIILTSFWSFSFLDSSSSPHWPCPRSWLSLGRTGGPRGKRTCSSGPTRMQCQPCPEIGCIWVGVLSRLIRSSFSHIHAGLHKPKVVKTAFYIQDVFGLIYLAFLLPRMLMTDNRIAPSCYVALLNISIFLYIYPSIYLDIDIDGWTAFMQFLILNGR